MIALYRRPTLAWLLLVGATLVSFEASFEGFSAPDHMAANLIILVLAFAKIGIVGFEFMEVTAVNKLVSLLFFSWVGAVAAILCYLSGQGAI